MVTSQSMEEYNFIAQANQAGGKVCAAPSFRCMPTVSYIMLDTVCDDIIDNFQFLGEFFHTVQCAMHTLIHNHKYD